MSLPWLMSFIAGSVHVFTNLTHFSHSQPCTFDNHKSALCIYVLPFCLSFVLDSTHSMITCIFLLCLTYSTYHNILEGLSCCCKWPSVHSFFTAEWYSIVYIYHVLFVYSSINEHLVCFHILAILNNATVNIGVHVSFQGNVSIFFKKYPEVKLLDHMVVLFLIFGGTSILFFIASAPIYISSNNTMILFFSTSLSILVVSCLFDNSRSNRCEVYFF